MSGVNLVILVGRLGKDPEVRYLPSGDAVANFSLATSDEWKDKDSGEKQSKVEWHNCVAFKRLGEVCGEFLKKGSQIYLEGKLQTRSWDDNGTDKYKTEIVLSNMQMLGNKESNAEPDQNQGSSQSKMY